MNLSQRVIPWDWNKAGKKVDKLHNDLICHCYLKGFRKNLVSREEVCLKCTEFNAFDEKKGKFSFLRLFHWQF